MRRASLMVASLSLVIALLAAFMVLPEDTESTTWESEKEISADAGTEGQFAPSIAVDRDRVHVVWRDDKDGDGDIYYRYFDGANWQPEQEISTDSGTESQDEPIIAVDDTKVHVVWKDAGDGDYDVYYRYFDGTSWQTELEISTDAGIEHQDDLSIAADDGKVYVVWADEGDGDYDVYYRHFDGTSWQPELEISWDIGWEWQTHTSIAVDNGKVHVAWKDDGDGDFDIYYRYFDGISWQSQEEISTESVPKTQWNPSIAVDGSEVHAVWGDNKGGDFDIYYRHFDGTSWQPELEISSDVGTEWQWIPSIAVDSGKVHVVWRDDKDGDGDIYYRYFDGIGWQPEQEINTDMSVEKQSNPSVAADRGIVHVVWEDERDGDFDIYYSRGAIALIPLPPSGLNAILSGSNLENVALSWNLSPDDGAGKFNVVLYEVYRGSSFETSGSSYLLHASVPAGTFFYVDAQAGEGNPANYFYYVCAVAVLNLTSCTVNQAGKFTSPLAIGPTLVSTPLIQSDESIETVLQAVKYDKAWYYDSSSQEWKWYMTVKGYRRGLWSADHIMGLWINATGPSNLTVAGIVPDQTTIHLFEGWNLVGFPSFNTSHTVADLKAEIGATRVEGYDPAPPYHLRVLGDAEVLLAGYGYWVKMESDADWIVEAS